MNFFFTVETLPKIVNYFNNSSKMASLVYESENCGFGVSDCVTRCLHQYISCTSLGHEQFNVFIALLINNYLLMFNLLIIQTSMNAKVIRWTTVGSFVSMCQLLSYVPVTKDTSSMLMATPVTVSGFITSQSCHRTLLYRAYETFVEHEIELTYAYRIKLSFKLFSLLLYG